MHTSGKLMHPKCRRLCVWYSLSLWLSVFQEHPESLFGDRQAHRGRYTMLMSPSGLNTERPLNTTFTSNPSQYCYMLAARVKLETHINASEFWQTRRSHQDAELFLWLAQTGQMEN